MTVTKIVYRKQILNDELNMPTTINKLQTFFVNSSSQINTKINNVNLLTKKQIKTVNTSYKLSIKNNKKIEIEEPKKRGRPSKEEIEKQEQERLKKENEIKDHLIQKGNSIIKKSIKIPTVLDSSVPLFKVGEYVKDKTIIGKKVFKGMVIRQDLNSPTFVLVAWKDGSRQWHGAFNLERITYADYKKKNTPDEIDANESDTLNNQKDEIF